MTSSGPSSTGLGRADSPVRVRALGLQHRFRSGRRGLAGLDLTARTGEIVALVGPNGAGKTTLLRILALQLRPSAGRVEILPPLPGWWQQRRAIGIAAEEDAHFDALGARENALFFARANGLDPTAAGAAVDALLDRFRLSAEAVAPAGAMSFGMRRKLTLVEAFAHEPALVLLDEPTPGLDIDALAALRALLTERAGAGCTLVFASHQLDMVAATATRVVFLHEGRIIGDGTPRELLAALDGVTTIHIEVAGAVPTLVFPAATTVRTTPAGYRIESRAGTTVLPGIVNALVEARVPVVSVRVSEPGLADVFHSLTGVEIPAGARELQA